MVERGGNLLIVDDNKVNRLLLTRSVEMLGHRASVAENGKQAMEFLQSQSFDLMLLDIEMPEMDGFEVLEAMHEVPTLRDLPVIVTSSVEGLDNIVRCIALGAEDYLPKPVNQTLLKARLSSCLEKKRLRDEQRELLRRFATSEVAEELETTGFAIGGSRVHASVLFCDIRGFTSMTKDLPPEEIIDFLNLYYTLMFEAITSHGGIVTLMIGDGLMAVFGAPQPIENTAQSAVLAAQDMIRLIEDFNRGHVAQLPSDVNIGIGIATGEVIAGYAGTDQRATYTCIGSTVNLAARLEAHTKVIDRNILIDEETRSALSADIRIQPIDPVRFKGFPNAVAANCVL